MGDPEPIEVRVHWRDWVFFARIGVFDWNGRADILLTVLCVSVSFIPSLFGKRKGD